MIARLSPRRAQVALAGLVRVGCVALVSLTLQSVASARASAQAAKPTVTTADGVYTSAQARSGGDVYIMLCQSCHAAITHTGAPFRSKWVGRTLADLYSYIREEMPKTEPGSLTEEEYTTVLAYILRMNGMPAGRRALNPNDASMGRIRIDMPVGDSDASRESDRPTTRAHP